MSTRTKVSNSAPGATGYTVPHGFSHLVAMYGMAGYAAAAAPTDVASLSPRDAAAESVRAVVETWSPEATALLYVTLHDGLDLRYDTAKATLRKAGWR